MYDYIHNDIDLSHNCGFNIFCIELQLITLNTNREVPCILFYVFKLAVTLTPFGSP